MPFNFKKANRYLPHILLIGIGIGSANYIMNDGDLNWMQWVVQSLSTCCIIGYTLVSIAANKSWFQDHLKPTWKLYLILFSAFFLIGGIATEIEQMIRALIFSTETYQPLNAGKMYLFNGIISLVLGFSFFQNNHFFPKEEIDLEQDQNDSSKPKNKAKDQSESLPLIIKVPVKQGDATSFISTREIVYIEAFDNYAFIYDLNGQKKLCDYSLLFLQNRLDDSFTRIHRKYIVNISHIKQIKPDSNARFLIHFDVPELAPIVSSKSYSPVIRSLIKIK